MFTHTNRRGFLKRAAVTTAGATLGLGARVAAQSQSSDDIYRRLVRANDRRVRQGIGKEQVTIGRGPSGSSARSRAYQLQRLAAAYCAPESSYYRSRDVVRQMDETTGMLLGAQHPDGTIDSGNLESPPDTAFVVEPLGVALANLNRHDSAELTGIKEGLRTFLLAAGETLTVGGVHTPNHRWGVCAALARINALYPAAKYVRRIDEWLSEGIDIDADGQFSERSTGNYSAVTDIWLITMARLLQRDQLLEPARRNLTLTLYHMHADGELETVASRRQDQWRRDSVFSARPVPDNFHLPYRYLALRDGNGQFATMTRLIEEEAGDELADNLGYFLEESRLKDELPPGEPLPADYARFFPASGLVRIRRGQVSASVYGGSDYPLGVVSGLAANPTFFTFRKGEAVLESVRMAPQFFRKGFFYSQGVDVQEHRYQLHQRLEVPYYQPLPEAARRADGDYKLSPAEDRFWSKMDFPAREKSNIKTLEQRVAVVETERGRFDLEVDIDGHDGVPVTLECSFRRGGHLVGVTPSPDSDGDYFLEQGFGRYQLGGQSIEFGPGQADHRVTRLESEVFDTHRGSIRPDGLRVYITAFTPFRKTITIG